MDFQPCIRDCCDDTKKFIVIYPNQLVGLFCVNHFDVQKYLHGSLIVRDLELGIDLDPKKLLQDPVFNNTLIH